MRTAIHVLDAHYPYQSKATIDLIIKITKDVKPTHLILHGDMIDNEAVSHWLEFNKRAKEGKRIKDEYEGFNEQILKPLEKAVGKNCKLVWLTGNHEDWTQQTLDKDPQYEGLIEIENYLTLEDRGWILIPLNEYYKFGKLCCIHGIYTNNYHAAKTVNAFENSVLYGHLHTLQVYTKIGEMDSNQVHSAYAVPCACNLKLKYNKNKPTKWINGLAITYLHDNGNFNTYPIVVINKQFIYAGKLYKSTLPQ